VRRLLLGFFLLISVNANATEYFIRTDGDDTNCTGLADAAYPGGGPGLACAFLTVQQGVDSATTAGDIITVTDGTYSGQVLFSAYSGSAEAEKVVSGVTKANPPVVTVTGHGYSNGDTVGFNWFDEGMTQLRIHWFTVANATTDTFELSGIDSSNWDTYTTGATVRRITPITLRAQNRGGAIMDLGVTVSGWTITGTANVWVSTSLGIGTGQSAYLWSVGDTTLFEKRESSLAAVNAENDYFYDSTNQLMYLYKTTDPNLGNYKSNYLRGIGIGSVQYVLVDGFDIRFTTPAISLEGGVASAEDIMLQYLTITYADGLGGMTISSIAAFPTRRVTIDNCTISLINDVINGANGHGIKFAANTNDVDGRYVSVSNSTIHTFRYQGIQFSNGWAYGDFRNNNIYNIAPQNNGGGTGIRTGHPSEVIGHSYVRIYDNDIGGAAGDTGTGVNTSIYIQEDSNNVQIYRNYLHDDFWHGIYVFSVTTGRTAYNIQIYNNQFVRLTTSGIRVEESSSIYAMNNTFVETGSSAIGATSGALSLNDNVGPDITAGVVFLNNVVYNTSARVIASLSNISFTSDFNDLFTAGATFGSYRGNTYTTFQQYQQGNVIDQNSIGDDPLLVNPEIDNTLSIASPARTSAMDLTGLGYFTDDYVQAPRYYIWDMGAYQDSTSVLATGVILGG